MSGAISLAMGEPDAGTPPRIRDAAVKALADGRTRYAAITGSAPLREALAERLSKQSGLALDDRNVVVTHGGSAGLASAVLALVRPGDRVLVPEPTYSLYVDHLAMVGAEAVWISNLPDGTLDLERIAAEAPKARMIVLCNPVNPTGAVFGQSDVRGLGAILASNPGLFLLSDEAYRDIVFDGVPFTSAMSLTDVIDRVVLVGTFSKSYAMTGWRLGFACAAPAVAASINLVHRTLNGPMNTFVQDAGRVALDIEDDELEELARSYERRRDLVMSFLNEMPTVSVVPPQGAFYAFPRIDSGLTSGQLAGRFAEGGVLVRAGSEFGPSGEGHVRLSFATDEASLREGMRRFAEVVKEL
ncbi:pyridoxal phosphate-dependent aminotransferase [Terrabacter sp. GCM10028922]|uniref:pyridoxal phosphate-dependent aminotransferase n=1 Tax=Terrabacter sp. GCM10028922 TaxID=3273428 RepID=UPI003621BDF5